MSVAGRGCQDGTRLFFLLINFFLSIVGSFFFPKMGKKYSATFLSFRVLTRYTIELLHVRSIAVISMTDQLGREPLQPINLQLSNC